MKRKFDAKLRKVGNSYVITIPRDTVDRFELVECDVEGEDLLKKGKVVGKVLVSKEGSNPMYISPGNLISVESSIELSKTLVNPPHKRPEPMHLAAKYAKEVRKELG